MTLNDIKLNSETCRYLMVIEIKKGDFDEAFYWLNEINKLDSLNKKELLKEIKHEAKETVLGLWKECWKQRKS